MFSKKELLTAETESLSFSSAEEDQGHPKVQQRNQKCYPQHNQEPGIVGAATSRPNTSYVKAMMVLVTKSWKQFQKDGKEFRKSLTSQDAKELKLARFLFHSCSVLPALVYYMGTVERPAKFPATISFTIRKGLPKHLQTLLWVSGWVYMARIIKRAGSIRIQKFCTKMFLTGVWTTQIFRLGQGQLSDVAHFWGALIYMLDHAALFEILNTKHIFRRIFYSSFAALVIGCGGTRAMEVLAGLPMESNFETSTADRARQLSKVNSTTRRKLFLWELLVMVSENLLFASFVQGMPSGLFDNGDDDADDTDDNSCEKKVPTES
mmetsp:Transcript_27606/g.38837  ORF Transcript_27606/g.38837 Transcript_27606/m.38837 type:complete len:321 (-) Transcript_27606:2120-3082(-)